MTTRKGSMMSARVVDEPMVTVALPRDDPFRSRYRLFVAILLLFTACRESPTGRRTRTTASSSAATSNQESGSLTMAKEPRSAPSTTAVSVARPADLDLTEVMRALGCGARSAKMHCSVLAEFATAGRFTGETPSGESRWLGRAYRIESGVERAEFLLLHCHKVPTAKVHPGSLPLTFSTSSLPVEVQVEAKRMWTSLSHGRHRANRRNLAFQFIEQYQPRTELGLIETTGTSLRSLGELSDDAIYLRQPSLKRLLLVQPARQVRSRAGDGTYAEFWQATW